MKRGQKKKIIVLLIIFIIIVAISLILVLSFPKIIENLSKISDKNKERFDNSSIMNNNGDTENPELRIENPSQNNNPDTKTTNNTTTTIVTGGGGGSGGNPPDTTPPEPPVAENCSDGTLIGNCSLTKPLYCNSSKELVNNCSYCGCENSFSCLTDQSCIRTIIFCNISEYSNTNQDVSQLIQACIANTPADYTLEIPSGKYYVYTQIKLNKSITLRTRGKTEAMEKCNVSDDSCAEFIASENFTQPEGLIRIPYINRVSVDHIIINGNKIARLFSKAHTYCRKPTVIYQGYNEDGNKFGQNFVSFCSNCKITNSVSKDAICGSGLVIAGTGKNVTFRKNTLISNGFNSFKSFSDGLTVHNYQNSIFEENDFIDNTDVDFVLGKCSNCSIKNNFIYHSPSQSCANTSFAGLVIQTWPGAIGDYRGANITNNTIDCGLNKRCAFGLLIGADPWYSVNVFGGSIYYNTIKNANLSAVTIDDAHDLEIYDNYVENSNNNYAKGTRSYNINTSRDTLNTNYLAINYDTAFRDRLIVPCGYKDSIPLDNLGKLMYECILQRDATPEEVENWRNTYQQAEGYRIEDSYKDFFNSPEYILLETTDETFVTQLYECILLRDPINDPGYYSYLNSLKSNPTQEYRNYLVNVFLISPEFADLSESKTSIDYVLIIIITTLVLITILMISILFKKKKKKR